MGLCTFIDVLFVVDPLLSGDGGHVAVDGGMFDLFSFVPRAGVEVFICSSVVGLFQAVEHGDIGALISFLYLGTRFVLGAVYIRPSTPWADWVDISQFMGTCDIVVGDFNARLPGLTLTDGACNHGKWLSEFMTIHGFTRSTPDEPTFRGITTIDHCISRRSMTSRYHYRASLEHAGVFFRFQADLPSDMMSKRPDWNKCDNDELTEDLCRQSRYAPNKIWGRLRSLVDRLPRSRAGPGYCKFWNDEREKMRLDIRRARRLIKDRPEGRADHNLV